MLFRQLQALQKRALIEKVVAMVHSHIVPGVPYLTFRMPLHFDLKHRDFWYSSQF
jgi:hypothetical protein